MAKFLMNFHHFPLPADFSPAPEEAAAVNLQWQQYIGGIAAQGRFVDTQRLDQAGGILGPDGLVTPVVQENRGLIVGTLTVEADDLDEAMAMARTCPVLAMGGSVEVRPVLQFDL
jgi:hypothetical protein